MRPAAAALTALAAAALAALGPALWTPSPSAADPFSVTLKAPVLSGAAVALFARLAATPVVGEWIVQRIKAHNRVTQATAEFAMQLKGIEPMHFPFEPPSEEELALATQRASQLSVEMKWSAVLEEQAARGEEDGRAPRNPFRTSQDLTLAYLSGETTPTEVVQRLLDLAPRVNAELGKPLTQVSPDALLQQARESTERYGKKQPLSSLDGVPVVVKDDLMTKGLKHTRGTNFLPFDGQPSAHDEEAIGRLRRAGAIILGSAAMHEIGVGVTGNNPSTGATARNPYNTEHYTGGSSSGAGALVGSNFVPLALGSDGGGSVRLPASLCGTVGFKPTFQRFGNVYAASSTTTSSLGVLSNSVHDLALAYLAMAGPASPRGHISAQQPPPNLHGFTAGNVTGLRVGVFRKWISFSEPSARQGMENALDLLVAQGALIVDDLDQNALPAIQTGLLVKAFSIVFVSEVSSLAESYWHNHTLNAESTLAVLLGRSMTSRDYLFALKVRRHFFRLFRDQVFSKVDVLLLPATGSLAPKIEPANALDYGVLDAGLTSRLTMFSSFANFLGLPAGVVPMGYDALTGLPLSAQVVADVWREDVVLSTMRLLESTGPEKQRGKVWWEH